MKKKEIQDLAVEELRHKETELRDEIFRLRMKRSASSLDNHMLIRNRRKDLARIITFLRQKEGWETGEDGDGKRERRPRDSQVEDRDRHERPHGQNRRRSCGTARPSPGL